jgi:serine phosphatase RsbU (regulator of sigma subunit)
MKIMEGQQANLYEIRPDKMPVAIYEKLESFQNNVIQLKSGDCIYMCSDGFADQFGGQEGKKFKDKPFKELLLQSYESSMEAQKQILDKTIEEWKAYKNHLTGEPHEQLDDICIVGVRIH